MSGRKKKTRPGELMAAGLDNETYRALRIRLSQKGERMNCVFIIHKKLGCSHIDAAAVADFISETPRP